MSRIAMSNLVRRVTDLTGLSFAVVDGFWLEARPGNGFQIQIEPQDKKLRVTVLYRRSIVVDEATWKGVGGIKGILDKAKHILKQ